MEELRKIYEKLIATPWDIVCIAIPVYAGKNQKRFIEQVNVGLKGNQNAYLQSLDSWKDMQVNVWNDSNIRWGTVKDENDPILWEKSMRYWIGVNAWWKLAHILDTQKARSLDVVMKYNILSS